MNTVPQLSDDEFVAIKFLQKQKKEEGKIKPVVLGKALAKEFPNRSHYGWKNFIYSIMEKFPKWAKIDLDNEYGMDKVSRMSVENQKLRNSLRETESEVRRLKNRLISQDSLLENIKYGMEKIPVIEQLPISIPKIKTIREDVVLMLTDIHINKVISADELEGYNSYNFDIFCNRYCFLIDEVIKLIESSRANKIIEVLHIDALGDMFNDIHRPEHVRSNEFNPMQAAIMGSYVLAQGIARLIPHFKKVKLTGVVGNEPRLDKIKPSSGVTNNFDYMAYHIISSCLSGYVKTGQIEFNIPLSPEVVIDRMGYKFLLQHGDQIKSWNGIPFYGLDRHAYKQERKRKIRGGYDYMELGHFHTPNKLKNILMGGSLCGVDEYAYHLLTEGKNPGNCSQKVFGLNEKYGVSWSYDIDCSEAQENDFVYSKNMTIADSVIKSSIV